MATKIKPEKKTTKMPIRADLSKQLFKALIKTTREAVIAINHHGQIVLFSPAAEEMFERKASEMIGNDLDVLMPAKYVSKHQEFVKNYFSSGKSRGALNRVMELPAVRASGEQFSIEISLSAGKAKTEQFIVAVVRDITERKRAEAALRSSEERYRSLQENLPVGIYRSTPEGKILSVNSAFVAILNYKSKFEVLSLSASQLYVRSDSRKKLVEKLIKDGTVTNFEVQLYKSDGKPLWTALYVRGVKNSEGAIRYFDGIVEDISERKQVERALIESEKKYRMLIETAQDIIIAHDLQGKIIFTNHAALKSLKYDKKDIEGEHIVKFAAPESKKDLEERIKLRLDGNTDLLLFNTTLLDSEGDLIPFEISSSVLEEENKPAICLVFGRDLSSRKKLEDQLHQTQKMDSVGTLAGGIAHDFNNLLTIINGLSEIALRKMKEEDPLFRDLRSIHAAGKKAEDLTRKLLTFSRKQIIHPKIIDINLLITDLDKMLRRLIREDIKIEKKLYPQALHIKADPGQIEQILINLVVNARDAIIEKQDDKKKLITISTSPQTINDNFVKKHPQSQTGTFHMISIRDSGVGMTREIIDKIFEPFFTTKEKGHGTGLGMSTVYGILKQNYGFVTIDSIPGKGSTFGIFWPTADEKIPEDESIITAIPDDESLTGTEHIIVVEDDPDVRYFTSFSLQNLGYEVMEFSSGLEALQYVKQQKTSIQLSSDIALVITDLIMPGMNGRQLATEIEKVSKHIKFLFTSGYTEDYILNEEMIGVKSNFIQKPFTMKLLAEKVRSVLDKNNASAD